MRWIASTERWRKLAEQTPPEKRLATIVESYLTPVHRDDPGRGCAVPTLGAEIARESPKTRKAFAAKLEQMIDMIAEQIPDVPRKAARKQAMAVIATMMGTLVLARVAGSGEFSDEILGAGRDAVLGRRSAAESGRRRNPAPREGRQPRRGTDQPGAVIAYDIGRMSGNAARGPHFRKCAARGNPFQTPQRLQDAAKTCAREVLGGTHALQSDILSAAARSRAHRGGLADVFEPMTGDVQAKVALASKAEVRAAVENAKAAQAEWAATNPQRRARVMMKFLELAQRDYDKLADLLAREHGKTVPDAKGDIQRGLEVVEFACGIPHLMKGEYTEGAGPGIDIYSMRQPLGVVAGITPFNFPAMIPMWKFAPAIACGNAFILKPSERDPGVPMALAELMIEAGLPPGILNVVNGDKEAVDAILDDPDIRAVGFVGSSPIAQYIYERAAATGKRAQCFGGAKNHAIVMPDADMDQTVDALIGAGYGSAGERCMAISVAVPVGKTTGRPADGKADSARRDP